VLTDIKSDPDHRTIPIVVFTTTHRVDDVRLSYRLGASSFISKPPDFKALCYTLQVVSAYWLDVVTLKD
jgi:two-component system response regulator